MPKLTLHLFGQPRVEKDGRAIKIRRNKALALIAYLAIEQRPMSRETLSLQFWPDYANGRAALRNVLHELNKSELGTCLKTTRKTVALKASRIWVDVVSFRKKLSHCTTHSHKTGDFCKDCLPFLTEAASLYQGDFMAGFSLADSVNFDTWQQQQGESLLRDLHNVLQKLTKGHEITNDISSSLDFANQWLRLNELNETAHRRLMILLAKNGHRSEALLQYQSCVQILDDELGVEPEEETTALYLRLRDGTPLPTKQFAFHQFVNPESAKHNLPLQPSPFIGRTKELATISKQLQEPSCRLLTIVGLGGVGKTRLALKVAAGQLENYADGVFFVNVASLDSPDLLPISIANAIGFSFYSKDSPAGQLLNYLRQKQMLLLLDNFEHLIKDDHLLSEILITAPDVRLLATSRERLNLAEEWLFPLEGLSVPTIDAADRYVPGKDDEAIQLFVQCAKRIKVNFSIQPSNQKGITQICKLLEGLPLGIELAAAWVRALSCEEILQQLRESLDFLSTTTLNIPERHQSLRAAIQYSWNFLTPGEKKALRRLAIFKGSFTKEAAEKTTDITLPLLLTLIDKSFIRPINNGRFEIHPLLKQFVTEKLEETPHENIDMRDKHGRYYAGLLAQYENNLKIGGNQAETLNKLNSEIENIRQAWKWLTESNKYDNLATCLNAFYLFYEMNNSFQEGFEMLERSINVIEKEQLSSNTILCARLKTRYGLLGIHLGKYEQSENAFQESIETVQTTEHKEEIALVCIGLGQLINISGNYEETLAFFEKSLANYQQTSNIWGIGRTYSHLGYNYNLLGDFQKATHFYSESKNVCEEIQDQIGLAISLDGLGSISFRTGQYDKSRKWHQEALTIREALGNQSFIGKSYNQLGNVAYILGDYLTALKNYKESCTIKETVGDVRGLAIGLGNIGITQTALGKYEEASINLQNSLKIYRETGNLKNQGNVLCNLGDLAFKREQYGEAQQYFEESMNVLIQNGDKWPLAIVFYNLGNTTTELGDLDGAMNWYEQGIELSKEIGNKRSLALINRSLGDIYNKLKKPEKANHYYREALSIAHEIQENTVVLNGLVGFAELFFSEKKYAKSLSLLSFVKSHPAQSYRTTERADETLRKLKGVVASALFNEAVRNGETADLDEVVSSLLATSEESES